MTPEEASRICKEECQAWCCKNRASVRLNCKVINGVMQQEGEGGTHTERCSKLNDDNTCSIYKDRPPICRNYACSLLAYFERKQERGLS